MQTRHTRTRKGLTFVVKGSIIKSYLNSMARMTSGKQREFYVWVLENGKSFGPMKRITSPQDVKHLNMYKYSTQPKQCYYNSQLSSLGNKLEYYEGWYVTDGIPIPLEHGFNVLNGKVVDFTAYRKFKVLEYFGVLIPEKFISKEMAKTGISGQVIFKYWKSKL